MYGPLTTAGAWAPTQPGMARRGRSPPRRREEGAGGGGRGRTGRGGVADGSGHARAGIERAQTGSLYKFTNKPDVPTSLAKKFNEDGMAPKVLHPPNPKRPVFNLKTSDIEGTKSRPKDVIKEPRGTNPLNPVYKLPKHVEQPPVAAPLVRESLTVSDIEGAQVGSTRAFVRDSLSCNDIEGAQPGWRPRSRSRIGKHVRDTVLNVQDINAKREVTVYPPMDPVEGSKPRPLTRERSAETANTSLRAGDIDGASSKTHENGPFNFKRRDYRKINFVGDIQGATSKEREVQLRAARSPKKAQLQARAKVKEEAVGLVKDKLEANQGRGAKNIWSICKHMDRDNSGKLTSREFEKVIARTDLPFSKADQARLMKGFDTDRSGFIDYKVFLKCATPVMLGRKHLAVSGQAKAVQPSPQKPAPRPETSGRQGGGGARAKENRDPAPGKLRRRPMSAAVTGQYVYVTNDMTPAGILSQTGSGTPKRHKRPPSVRSSAQGISIRGLGNIAPGTKEWRPSAQALALGKTLVTTELKPGGAGSGELNVSQAWSDKHSVGGSSEEQRGRSIRFPKTKPVRPKPRRPFSANDALRLSRAEREYMDDVASVRALQ